LVIYSDGDHKPRGRDCGSGPGYGGHAAWAALPRRAALRGDRGLKPCATWAGAEVSIR